MNAIRLTTLLEYKCLILILIFLFFLRGRDEHHEERGYGYGGGYCAPKPLVPLDCCEYEKGNHLLDKDLLIESCKTREHETEQAEKTRALIDLNYREQANRDFQKQLQVESELKNKIYMLENERFNERKFDAIERQLGQIECNMPRTAPCFVPTCSSCTFPSSTFNTVGGCGCGCDRDRDRD